jgi:transposase InsO family protein
MTPHDHQGHTPSVGPTHLEPDLSTGLRALVLHARVWTSEADRAAAITVWNVHYNYHRAHTAVGNRPPASRLHAGVTNVVSQNG